MDDKHTHPCEYTYANTTPMNISEGLSTVRSGDSHPYEYTYANPTPMSTSEGLSTDRSGDSHPYKYTYANPTPMNTSEGLSRQIWRFPKSPLTPHSPADLEIPEITIDASSTVLQLDCKPAYSRVMDDK
jgi:hypothetical protein